MSEQQKPEQQAKPEEQEKKLSPAELKKRAKEEKLARRAAVAAQKQQQGIAPGGPPASEPNGVQGPAQGGSQSGGAQQQKPKGERPQLQQKGPQKKGGAEQAALAVRSRSGSQSGSAPVKELPKKAEKKPERKQVELLSHLYTQPRRQEIEGASKDVHPAVLALGLQTISYEICGSSARCVAMLLAFKTAIQDYTTPQGTSLARHLTSHYLSPQIDFLKSCRPISESMGNAIRWLKKLISPIDPDTDENQAKRYLCDSIDRFIQERIMVTDQAIASAACKQITEGSVVLTYAKSSLVEKTILRAHSQGVNFRVIVVDSRPLFEGKKLATSLMNAGLHVEYLPFSGIARAVTDATVVLLGAHSMLSNGRLQSRVGTAPLAMAAYKADIPVIVCCESVKFSGKVALDSIVINEVAAPEELLPPPEPAVPQPPPSTSTKPDKKKNEEEDEEVKLKTLRDWREIANLQILNIMYDVTPAEYIRMIICEYGSVPPSSVPVVHRIANEGI